MPTRDASYVMCTALYMMVLYDRARVGPTTKTSDEISIICLFPYYSASQSLFCFCCGIRVASMSSVDSIPSPNGVLILRCGYQSFLIIKIVFSILFTGVFSLQVVPIFFNIRKINSSLLNVVCFIRPKLPLFSRRPTLFLQGLRFLNHVSFYLWEVSSFFYFNVLIR